MERPPPILARLTLFGGRGGVGKTVCAAASALLTARAEPSRDVYLLSLDPAHSLADALADEGAPANLTVEEVDAGHDLHDFKRAHGETLAEIARRGTFLDEEDIRALLDLATPGLDEIVALLRISALITANPTARFVIDTAPCGHTLRLLRSLSAIDGWIDALDALLAKHRYLATTFARGYREDETDALIADLRRDTAALRELLASDDAAFVVVAVAEPLCLRESAALRRELGELGVKLGALVVNRLITASACPVCTSGARTQRRALAEAAGLLAGVEAWGLPLLDAEPRGAERLAAMLAALRPLAELAIPAASAGARAQARGGEPLAREVELVLVTGKGGVGKTTVAAALAVAAAARGEAVSLVSTDPAPSLATCLLRPIRGEPLAVTERLEARALDAEAAWTRWREDYREELQASLERSSSGIDLTFDREVVERLLELTPPGIDEIVAITELVELAEPEAPEEADASSPWRESRAPTLAAVDPDSSAETCGTAQYGGASSEQSGPTIAARGHTGLSPQAARRLLVIDTAATGHFLRLIGMPEVLESWLHAIFRVLLKYREILRLPKLSDRLIALSRGLKRLRALLGDPSRSEVWVVTIPTEMAKAEADDLLAALARLDLTAARIWINQVTPRSESCPLCAALNAREGAVVERWRADHRPGTIGRGEPPLGLDALARLGDGLLGGDGVHE